MPGRRFLLINWSSSLGDLVIFQIYVLGNTSSPVDAPIPLLHSEKAGNFVEINQILNQNQGKISIEFAFSK